MRPRQICRGILRRTLRAEAVRSFNEAPADLPGNYRRSVDEHRPRLSFNEAPADLPGNFEAGPRSAARALRFNEAPADLPGN